MDIHVQGNPRLHYVHNGYHQASHSKDDGLQFLSLEEKECILFFEETIDSLGEDFEEDNTVLSSGRRTPVGDVLDAPSPAISSAPTTPISPDLIEHDIIDLVHSTPDFTMPDFQNLAVVPQTHFEMKPKRDPTENISTAATFSDPYQESSHQLPPGSVPTPVIIASKIAEHNGTGGTSLSPSVLVQHRRSLESPQSPPSKLGPPTHAKPQRLPDNINMILGSRDPTPQSIATAAVNMQERRSQMLANLPASGHPLEGGEPACVHNPPSRSVSFRDPTPDKSRMEALSVLGLTQGRTLPPNMVPVTGTKIESGSDNSTNSNTNKVGISADIVSNSAHTYNNIDNKASISPNTTVSQKNSSPYKASSSAEIATSSSHTYNNIVNNVNISPNTTVSQRRNSSTTVTQSSINEPKARGEIVPNNSYGGKTAIITAATKDTFANHANHDKRSSTAPALTSAEVTHSDFNSYGGKTIMLNPTSSFRTESVSSHTSPPARPEPADLQNNSYGSRSRVINLSTQTDPPVGPACRPRSNSHSPSSTITSSTHHTDLHSPIGGKSRIFPPAKADGPHPGLHYSSTVREEALPDLLSHEAKRKALSPSHPDPVYQPVDRNRSATLPPAPAPRPQRPTGSLRPVPAEVRSRPPSKPSFRTQGITVQFSGKGATDEARRDALRRLGLLKDTS